MVEREWEDPLDLPPPGQISWLRHCFDNTVCKARLFEESSTLPRSFSAWILFPLHKHSVVKCAIIRGGVTENAGVENVAPDSRGRKRRVSDSLV